MSHLGRDHMVFGLLLPVKSVPITTNVVSSYPIHDKVYSMQHYVIKFVSDLAAVRWFSLDTPGSSINQTDCHDITEILLKVVLNTINLNLLFPSFMEVKCTWN